MFASRIFGLVAGLLLIIPVAGCGLFDTGPSAEQTASSFLRSFAAGDAAAAAGRTDAPAAARPALEAARQNLAPQSVTASLRQVREGDRSTSAEFDVRWDFGGGRVWSYPGRMELTEQDEGWKVRWSPSVLHPELSEGRSLALREQRPEPAPVLDRDGNQLMGPEQLVTVTLDPRQAGDLPGVAGALAGPLGEIDPQITQQSVLDGVAKTPPGQPYTVVTLRQADYERVRSRIYELPGVQFPAKTQLVAAERSFGSQVLPGIAKLAEKQIAANSGWRVVVVDEAGAESAVLHDVPSRPVEPVRTALSGGVQQAAEQALDPVPQGAMVVAMQPSTGDVLAVAQNEAADKQGSLALTGQYPPGSTFKIATAAAALRSGTVGIDTPVQCPAMKTFDGRDLPNDKNFDLGTVPLRTAFAKSCNTTFAQLSVDQPADALPKTAHQLGIGVDFDMPGAITLTGKVPEAPEVVHKAANGIGQGSVLVSPFGMALAASTVAHGSMPVPTLVRGTETKADAQPEPLPPQVLDQLRPMMREVVTAGTATAVAGAGEVAGKTGTAQFGDGTHAHGWFVGYRGDLAFAVLLTDAGESKPAVQVAQSFLSNTK